MTSPWTLDELTEQELDLQFDRFDNDTAWELGSQLVAAARAAGLPVVVAIHRNGQRLFHVALPGTSADNDAWVERKARVVARFGHSSFLIGERCRAKGSTFEETMRLDQDSYAAHGGSFPVTVRGVGVVGSVTVSGLPQVEDHRFVVAQLTEYSRLAKSTHSM
ncbi:MULTISPECIES: heme-degrading domain-containing protein [unclassified Crossiella]|uniref:heme-degrading domain-containing protein n=1 Tax=unclassified Crossiella TaxID=2620835 RepID=UPI001FFE64E2|nr:MULTISPECIES: heme-degrading domain-containing protein [unclassified Crossiella]MCK2243408.1 heme-degrading domain-containing protein [Crossiella sp. S99.2]MCK2254123.1 heme-degrading domain-containing protein [Crossiella sp. S99.1]